MDFIVHKHDDRILDLECTGERRTVLMLLKERLLMDDKVESATVIQDHPVLDEPRILVRTEKGRRPETAVKNAAGAVRKDLDELEDLVLDAL